MPPQVPQLEPVQVPRLPPQGEAAATQVAPLQHAPAPAPAQPESAQHGCPALPQATTLPAAAVVAPAALSGALGAAHAARLTAPVEFDSAVPGFVGTQMTLLVVGAGLGRTGTHSLKLALEELLDAPCYHMMETFGRPDDVPVWRAAVNGDMPDWEIFLADYVAAVDWPAAAF